MKQSSCPILPKLEHWQIRETIWLPVEISKPSSKQESKHAIMMHGDMLAASGNRLVANLERRLDFHLVSLVCWGLTSCLLNWLGYLAD